jgi:hypothetical protein
VIPPLIVDPNENQTDRCGHHRCAWLARSWRECSGRHPTFIKLVRTIPVVDLGEGFGEVAALSTRSGQEGAGQRVRGSGRPPEDGEALEAEPVGEGGHVCGPRGDGVARSAVGTANPGAVGR